MLCAMLSPLGLRGFVERAGNGVTVTAPPAPNVVQGGPAEIRGEMAVAVMGDVICPPAPPQAILGKMMMPVQGGIEPPATQPATQPARE
jgi:hypothetical protein